VSDAEPGLPGVAAGAPDSLAVDDGRSGTLEPALGELVAAGVTGGVAAGRALAAVMRPDSRLARRSSSSTLGGPTGRDGASIRAAELLSWSALAVPGLAFAAA
jgi:hypothetical protein